MNKKTLLCGVLSASAILSLATVGFGKNAIRFSSADNLGGKWVHYAQRNATSTLRGVREYWVQCGGSYQFTAPVGATIEDATAYDTSDFTDTDARWINYCTGTVFYDLSKNAYDFSEASQYAAYTTTGTASDTAGKTANLYFTAGDNVPAMQATVLTVTQVLKTKADMEVLHENEANVDTINGYYVLGNDIDMQNSQSNKGAASGNQAYGFRGTLDGRGRAIKNYYPTWKPIFGMIGYNALVKNFSVEVNNFQLANQHGVLSRNASKAYFENISIKINNVAMMAGKDEAEGLKCGILYGFGNTANSVKNVSVDATGVDMYGLLGDGLAGDDTFENVSIKCKSYRVVGVNNGASVTTVPAGVTVTLDE